MIVIIVGKPRTGSSLVAGLLHHAGIKMGKDIEYLSKPWPNNVKGQWEDEDFRNVNESILAYNGCDLMETTGGPPNPLRVAVPHVEAIRDLLSVRDTWFRNWGWKDPRNVLTIDAWLSMFDALGLDDYKLLRPMRDVDAIVKSAMTRGHPISEEDIRRLLAEWDVYLDDSLQDEDYLEFNYEDLIGNPDKELADISEYLGYEVKDVTGFMDKELKHH